MHLDLDESVLGKSCNLHSGACGAAAFTEEGGVNARSSLPKLFMSLRKTVVLIT